MTAKTTVWTPPKGTKIQFWIEPVEGLRHPTINGPGMTYDEYTQARTEFLAAFRLPTREYANLTLRLNDARWPQLLDAIEESSAARRLRIKSCWIEEPAVRGDAPGAWFEMLPAAGFRSPSRPPSNRHFSFRNEPAEFVASQPFLDAVHAASLTGLDCLPLEDASSSDPVPWFQIFATHPLGRGLDHPLNDPAKIARSYKDLPPSRRWGIERVKPENRRDDAFDAHPMLERLSRICEARIAGPERFVREHLPATDFAYFGWGWDDTPRRDLKDRMIRPNRSPYCSSRARAVLIGEGLMKPAYFEAVAIVAAADAGVPILDRVINEPVPLPDYTPEEAAVERTRREGIIRAKVAKPSRAVSASTTELLAAVSGRLAESAPWTPARDDPAFSEIRAAKLFAKTPTAWQQLAPFLPLEVSSDDFDFRMAAPQWNDWVPEDDCAFDADAQPSKKDLILAHTAFGDWYAVRKGDPLLPADARVVHWDHETMSIADEWPSVASFAAHVIAACDGPTGDTSRPTA